MEDETARNNSLDYLHVDVIIRGSVGTAGLCTGLFAVVVVFCFKLHKHFVYRIAMYKVVSTMLVSLVDVSFTTYLLQGHKELHRVLCVVTGFLLMHFFWINILFIMVIVFHIFSLAVCLKNLQNLEIYYVLFSVFFPLLFTWIPFINHNYGPVGTWCWITGRIEQFALWFIPSCIILVTCIVAAVTVVCVLFWRGYRDRNNNREPLLNDAGRSRHKKALVEILPLLAYPPIFFFFNGFVVAYHIIKAVRDSPIDSSIGLAQTGVVTSWGIASSVILLVLVIIARWNKMKRPPEAYVSNTVTIQDNNDGGRSKNTATVFSIPRESEVDKKFND